jgi:hypothetical protein
MRIADVIMFRDELQLLRVRLAEHSPFVQRFYLVEATRTLRYAPKPLTFAEHRQDFSEWSHKIEHIVVDADRCFRADDPFGNERLQRGFANQALPDEFSQYDYVMYLDVDEIIDRRRFPRVLEMMRNNVAAIAPVLDLFFYFLNAQLERQWSATRIFAVRDGRLPDVSVAHGGAPTSQSVGWHFSFLGSPSEVRRKLASFSHVEFDLPEFNDDCRIAERMRALQQPFGTDSVYAKYGRLIPRSPGDWLPIFIQEHMEEYTHLLYEAAPGQWVLSGDTAIEVDLQVRQLATRVREQEAQLHEIAEWATRQSAATEQRDAEIVRLQSVIEGAVAERDAEIARLQRLLTDAVAVRDVEIARLQQLLTDAIAVRDAEIGRLNEVCEDAVAVRDAEIRRLQTDVSALAPDAHRRRAIADLMRRLRIAASLLYRGTE